ncbi:hypothetical protein B1R32_107138 [Abditibacterium utsteinense]|uniref:Uncharacterized protein n=1 Tax=Abditibacterium utsteinense TaxID=1960156 RepID=A0A2S8STI0_9BACT|nr:hypothetical protein B1R32_107138 [Abditibacterium utsteinense]
MVLVGTCHVVSTVSKADEAKNVTLSTDMTCPYQSAKFYSASWLVCAEEEIVGA